jgi:hypothetical protein
MSSGEEGLGFYKDQRPMRCWSYKKGMERWPMEVAWITKIGEGSWWIIFLKYTVIDGILYRRTLDGLLLKCLGEEEAKVAMSEVHDGMCGAHQATDKMKWLIRRSEV